MSAAVGSMKKYEFVCGIGDDLCVCVGFHRSRGVAVSVVVFNVKIK